MINSPLCQKCLTNDAEFPFEDMWVCNDCLVELEEEEDEGEM